MNIRYDVSHICSSSSIRSTSSNSDLTENCEKCDKWTEISYNPIERHLIMLRRCSLELDQLINEAEEAIEKRKELASEETVGTQLSAYSCKEFPSYQLPEFPGNYPVADPLAKRRKVRLKFKGILKKDEVKNFLEHFVKSVLVQVGYSDELTTLEDSDTYIEAVEQLVELADRFLKCLTDMLRTNKYDFYPETNDLLEPLNKTLYQIKFSGINGLHQFYSEKILKKHELLLSECEENLQKYQELRAQFPRTMTHQNPFS